MCFFRKNHREIPNISSKFHVGDFVDFWHRDDVYFGIVSGVEKLSGNSILYDIDIAGQCPTTFTKIPEEKVIRIHKEN